MLIRINTGELVEINKYNFSNDKLYYQKIMDLKKPLAKSMPSVKPLVKSLAKSLTKSSTKLNKNI
uniref:Uncharacterized protein n=1 Tax=viral metagenome TaxID=1070528 RepID=A0A6C0AQB9_9ZZZZ